MDNKETDRLGLQTKTDATQYTGSRPRRFKAQQGLQVALRLGGDGPDLKVQADEADDKALEVLRWSHVLLTL